MMCFSFFIIATFLSLLFLIIATFIADFVADANFIADFFISKD